MTGKGPVACAAACHTTQAQMRHPHPCAIGHEQKSQDDGSIDPDLVIPSPQLASQIPDEEPEGQVSNEATANELTDEEPSVGWGSTLAVG